MSIIWKDGQFLDGTLPQLYHDDSGLSGGLGIFDSMLALNSVLINPMEHFERILHDVETVLGMGPSWLPGFVEMTAIWQPLLSENNLSKGHARIRTTITGGISNGPLTISKIPTILVTVAPSGAPQDVKPVACAVIHDFPRTARNKLENCKRLDYSRSFAARRAAQALGAEEAIMTNTDGNIACGSTSNLFIRENGLLITPPLSDGVLAGVTRRLILESNDAVQDSISVERLFRSDEVFLTNSFVGLRKVILQE